MKVMVLGAGLAGVATAYYLRQAGCAVTVLESRPLVGVTVGRLLSGCAVPWAGPPPVRQVWRERWAWPPGRHPAGDWQWLRWWWLVVRSRAAVRQAADCQLMRQLTSYSTDCLGELCVAAGMAEVIRPGGVVRLLHERRQQADAVTGWPGDAVPLPGAVVVDGCRLVRRLVGWLRAAGVEFRCASRIGTWQAEGDRLQGLRVDGVLKRADHYVLTLDERVPDLLGGLGVTVPLRLRPCHVLLGKGVDAAALPAGTVLDEVHKVAISRQGRQLRIEGLTELPGMRPGLSDLQRGQLLAMTVAAIWPPAGDRCRVACHSGLQWVTPDAMPVVGASAYANLWLNFGHACSGQVTACGAARSLADRLAGKTAHISSAGLDIFRYAAR